VKSRRNTLSAWKRLRHRGEIFLLGLAAWTLPRLPRGAVTALAGLAGWLAYHLMGASRRVALANLEVAFGESLPARRKRRIARASFQRVTRTLFGLFESARYDRDSWRRVAEVEESGLRLVREIRRSGRGIVFITLHYGDWELMGLVTGWLDIPLTVIAEQRRNRALDRLINGLRARSGNRLVPQRLAALKLFKALKRGECVALLVDLNAPLRRGGVWLDFFGLPVFNTATAAALALRARAAIVPGIAYPLPDGRSRLVYGPEIVWEASGNQEADLQRISQQCLRFCEEVIGRDPRHWLWSYKRWKYRPNPEAGRYPFYSRDFMQRGSGWLRKRAPRVYGAGHPDHRS
jgi:KDO2-lipid IV(A) lauroyltransferase